MIDFEAEYALMTTKPPFDPNEDQMDVMDMSSNEDSITLRGDTNADTYVLFMMSLKYSNYCLEFKSLQHDCLISYVSI